MRLEFLKKRLARLSAKYDTLSQRALASEDANEVRSINEQLTDLNADIADIKDEIAMLEEEQRAKEQEATEARDNAPVANANITRALGSFTPEQRSEDMHDSVEYREAFKAYVQRGAAIPAQFIQRGESINTQDTGAAIPTTIMNEVINTIRKRYGNLYNKVRKLNVPGGVEIPIGSLEASFKWISESTVSPRQDIGSLSKVTFAYHTAEIRIAQSFLSSILTLSSFEAEISKVIARAYLKAMDYGIVNGSGNGCMLGILNDARVTNTITMTAAQMADWTQWRKRLFAKLPLGYRAGEFIFPMSTVETYLETMADSNNNPIFRQATGLEVGDGDAQYPAGRFFGREISLVETDIIKDFDTASSNDVVGIYWQPEEYGINENFGFSMRRYFDEETNEWVDKAITVLDGKVINPTGFYKILKA